MAEPKSKVTAATSIDEQVQVPKAPTAAAFEPAKTADEVAGEDEETVPMVFPRPVMIMLPDYTRVSFDQGVQDVPKSLSTHPYLKDNGVQLHVRKGGNKAK